MEIQLTGDLRNDRYLLIHQAPDAQVFKVCKERKYRHLCNNEFWKERYFYKTGENSPLSKRRNDPKVNWKIVYKNAVDDINYFLNLSNWDPIRFFSILRVPLAYPYPDMLNHILYVDENNDLIRLDEAPRWVLNTLYFLSLPQPFKIYLSEDEEDYIEYETDFNYISYISPIDLLTNLQENLDYPTLIIIGFQKYLDGYLMLTELDSLAYEQKKERELYELQLMETSD